MTQKWTALSSTTDYDRLANEWAMPEPVALSDGTLVFLATDGVSIYLYYSSDHVTLNEIGTVAGLSGASGTGLPIALCVDTSNNNIYVIGESSGVSAQAFKKGTGYTWTAEATLTTSAVGACVPLAGRSAVWLNTGGGTGGAGHILVTVAPGGTSLIYWLTFDAGALLAGTGTLEVDLVQGAYPSDYSGYTVLAADGPWPSGLAATLYDSAAVQFTQWSVSSAGAITIGQAYSGLSAANGKLQLLFLVTGWWACIYPSANNPGSYASVALTAQSSYTVAEAGVPANLPLSSGGNTWGAFSDPTTAYQFWVIAPATVNGTSLPVYRLKANFSDGTITWSSSVTADDTLTVYAATSFKFAAVSQPNGQQVDWMVTEETASGTWALLGDASVMATTPTSTLVNPANGAYVDVASLTLGWTYSDVDGSTQAYWALRSKLSGASAYNYWNNATLAWQSTIVWNAGASSGWTPPSGAFTNANTYNWSAAVESSYGLQGAFPADSSFVAQAAPTATVTGPTGTVATSQPTVTYTTTVAAGTSITSYRILIYPQSIAGASGFSPGVTPGAAWDSGVITGAPPGGGVQVPVALANVAHFVPVMVVTETGNESSAWATGAAFEVSYGVPPTPVLTVANADDPNGVDCIELVVLMFEDIVTALATSQVGSMFVGESLSGGGAGGGYSTDTNYKATVTYSDAYGSGTLRYGDAVAFDPGAPLFIYDYEAIPEVPRTYTLAVSADAGTAIVTTTPVIATATLSVSTWWFIEPLTPANSIPVNVTAGSLVQHENISVAYFLSADGVPTAPSVQTGGINKQDGQITIQTQSASEWLALKASLVSGTVKWLISPLGDGIYARVSAANPTSGQSGAAHQTTLVQSPATTPVRSSVVTFVELAAP